MGLVSNPAMRKQVKNDRAFFNAKDRRLKVSTQNKVPATPGTAAHGCHGGNLRIKGHYSWNSRLFVVWYYPRQR